MKEQYFTSRVTIAAAIVLWIMTASAVVFRATVFNALWIPYGALVAYAGSIIVTGALIIILAHNVWHRIQSNYIRLRYIAWHFLYTTPSVILLTIAVIARSMKLTTLKTAHNKFDYAIVLWIVGLY